MIYEIHTDGGARGNPGPAAIGAVIASGRHQVHVISRCIGETTNNVAEYQAIIAALSWVVSQGGEAGVRLYADSLLVINQLRRLYRVKEPALQVLHLEAAKLARQLKKGIEYIHVPREQNQPADRLVNEALDKCT